MYKGLLSKGKGGGPSPPFRCIDRAVDLGLHKRQGGLRQSILKARVDSFRSQEGKDLAGMAANHDRRSAAWQAVATGVFFSLKENGIC